MKWRVIDFIITPTMIPMMPNIVIIEKILQISVGKSLFNLYVDSRDINPFKCENSNEKLIEFYYWKVKYEYTHTIWVWIVFQLNRLLYDFPRIKCNHCIQTLDIFSPPLLNEDNTLFVMIFWYKATRKLLISLYQLWFVYIWLT